MKADCRIIRAAVEHAELIAPLLDGYRQFYQQPSDLAAARAFIAERLRSAESEVFLALRDQAAVGFTQLYPAFSTVALRRIWILNDLYVAPEQRRTGVGRQLLAAAEDFARSEGARRLVLATARDNATAQALYQAMGWVRDETFEHYKLEL